MPISHALRCIYVHVPKCAGTSLSIALNRAGTDFQLIGRASAEQREALKHVWLQHLPAHTLIKHLPAGVWRSYFKFGFVRNPWDWLVSLYHQYHREKPDHTRISSSGKPPQGETVQRFQHWAQLVCRAPSQTRGASYYLTDASGAVAMDFVGRYERLADDYAFICRQLNVAPELPHANASERAAYREYYSDDLRVLVARTYQDDIENFGYTFNGTPHA
jgi:hypothetical protein